MGIARYFSNIIKKNPNVYDSNKPSVIDNFFIDFNAIVYKVILMLDKIDEKILIEEVVKFLIFIIDEINAKFVYIAMDGPVPRAKMVQQRFRRYKAIVEQDFKKELEKKYSVKIIKDASASLCFVQKGKFEYYVKSSAFYPEKDDKVKKGTIIIQ